jgi:hypothetical protein
LMEPAKITQDTFNDLKNAERENYEKGWPATYFMGDSTDYNTIADTRSAPGLFHLIKNTAPGQTIAANIVYKEPGFDVPQSFVNAIDDYRAKLQPDLVGALPALTGNAQASGGDKTASGQAMDRSQAMGIIGPAWSNIQRMWGGVYTKACLLASKNPDHGKEIATLKSDGSKATLQLGKIRKGTFKAKPDVDSSFPDSTAAKRQMLQQLLPLIAPTPLGAALFQSPDNWEEIIEVMGNQDLVLIPAIAYKKQMRETEILLSEAPVPNTAAIAAYDQQHAAMALQAIAAGMPEPPYQPPPPMAPSIMPEMDDFHLWESGSCAETLSGEDVWLRMKTGDPDQIAQNLAGIQNLRLHKGVHDQMLAMQTPPPLPMPGPAIPKPKGGPPGAPEAAPQIAKTAAPPGAGAPSV